MRTWAVTPGSVTDPPLFSDPVNGPSTVQDMAYMMPLVLDAEPAKWPTLVQQFLDIALAQGKLVVEPEGRLNDAQRESVAVGLAISHGRSAYRGLLARTWRGVLCSRLALRPAQQYAIHHKETHFPPRPARDS